jgi:hypothetical protein
MVAIVVMVIGGVAALGGIVLLVKSARVRGWPVVPGRITERGVGASTTTGASRPGRYFEPRVRYTYSVEGTPYTGTRLSPVTAAYGEAQAKRVADKLPDAVTVRYNPRDPADAYLKPASLGLAVLALLVGVVCVAGGALALFSPPG